MEVINQINYVLFFGNNIEPMRTSGTSLTGNEKLTERESALFKSFKLKPRFVSRKFNSLKREENKQILKKKLKGGNY